MVSLYARMSDERVCYDRVADPTAGNDAGQLRRSARTRSFDGGSNFVECVPGYLTTVLNTLIVPLGKTTVSLDLAASHRGINSKRIARGFAILPEPMALHSSSLRWRDRS